MILNVINFLINAGGLKTTVMGMTFNLVCDVYVTVARVYDILMNIVSTKLDINNLTSSLTSTIYVLMAIFMLFRITVSFLNMLIDPDKTNDNQAGAGAIIKRAAIAIVLLLALKPGSYAMKFLDRLEEALLANDGLISNMVGSIPYDSLELTDQTSNDGVYDCYYFINKVWGLDNVSSGSDAGYAFHFRLSKDPSKLNNSKGVSNYWNRGYSYYFEMVNDTITYNGISYTFRGNTQNATYNIGPGYPSNRNACPSYITSVNLDYDEAIGTFRTTNNGFATLGQWTLEVYSSEEEFVVGLGRFYINDLNSDWITVDYHDASLGTFAEAAAEYYKEYNETNVSAGSLAFARAILKSFITSSGGNVNELTEKLLINSEANNETFEAYDDGEIAIDVMISLIAGIALVIYLVFLCVDAVVRYLKLTLLQIISPVATISYIDPKSTVFEEWRKMYTSTYLGLFLKLFAIGFIVAILDIILEMEYVGWAKLFYIFGLLVFIKVIPTMISKIFGIDMSTGSFKEIGGLFKKGAGIAVGGVAAAGAGLVTGAIAGAATKGNFLKKLGAGVLRGGTSAFSGTLRGAGSGYSGNVLGGARSVSARNAQIREANLNGSTWLGRLGASAGAAIGLSSSYERQAKDIEKAKINLQQKQRQNSNTSSALANLNNFKQTVTDNLHKKSGASGYRNLKEVQNWQEAQAALKVAQDRKVDDYYTEEQKKQDILAAQRNLENAEKIAIDAALNEEFKRIKANAPGADAAAKSALHSYQTYIQNVDGREQYSDVTDATSLSSVKNILEERNAQQNTDMEIQQRAIEEREAALNNSGAKADYEAVKNKNQ